MYDISLDEKSNLQIPSNLLQRFGTAAVCIVLLIFISGLYDFTLHLQIRKYDGLTYCGRITKIITTAFYLNSEIIRNHIHINRFTIFYHMQKILQPFES